MTARKHLAVRGYTSGRKGVRILCRCGEYEAVDGTVREQEDAHRAHRVAMGETVKPRALTKVERLEAEIEKLRAELGAWDAEARERWVQKQVDEFGVRCMDFRNGVHMELEPARDLLAAWVASARTMLGDAPNYTETVCMDVKVAESPEMYTLVVQRHAPGTLTPHQARLKAEEERDEARAELTKLAETAAALDGERTALTAELAKYVGQEPTLEEEALHEHEQQVREKVTRELWHADLPIFGPGEEPNMVARIVRAVDARIAEHGVGADYANPTSEPLVAHWERTVIHPGDDGEDTVVCCMSEGGQQIALLLDDENRVTLWAQLVGPEAPR